MMPVHTCTDCSGRGTHRVVEPDEPARVILCEGCMGEGTITSCRDCVDPVPTRFADDHGGLCPSCAEAQEAQDAAEEMFRIGRRAQG